MVSRLKTLLAGFILGAAASTLFSMVAKAGSIKNLRAQVSAGYQKALAEGSEAAEIRRQELREQLAAMIAPPEED